ncbi:MAG TPA: hypothetical protein VJZ51_06920 [Bacilli bacterium]|nr:hypothetical protein [Bacilli bacterium]
MHKVLELSKIVLKNSSNIFVSSKKKGRRQNKKAGRIFAIIGFTVLYVYLAGIMGFSVYSITHSLAEVGETNLLSPILGLIVVITSLFFGVFMMFSTFFTSSDNHLWLPLPLKVEEIFTARFISTFFYIIVIQLVFVLPSFIGFNLAAGPGILTYFGQFFIFIATPIIVISLSFIVILMLSRIINIRKYFTIFQVVSAILMFTTAIGISLVSSFGGPIIIENADDFGPIVEAIRGAGSGLSWAFFITFFTDGAFINLGYKSLLLPFLLLLFAGLTFYVAYLLAGKYYHASLFSIDIKKKKRTKERSTFKVIKHNPVWALFSNEVKTILRSPTFVFNLLLPPLLVPLITIGSALPAILTDTEMAPNVTVLIPSLFDSSLGFMFVAIVGASSFISMMNLISATTFTREGNNAQLLKIYPLSTRQIIYGKMLLGVFVNTLIIVPLIIVLAIIAGAQFYLALMYIVAFSLVNLLMNYSSIILDARFPLLNWTNEIEAAKNNKNILIAMGVNFLITGFVFVFLVPAILLALPTWLIFIMFVIVFSIIIGIFELYITKVGPRLFKKIQ